MFPDKSIDLDLVQAYILLRELLNESYEAAKHADREDRYAYENDARELRFKMRKLEERMNDETWLEVRARIELGS